jgi:hypothetical protein
MRFLAGTLLVVVFAVAGCGGASGDGPFHDSVSAADAASAFHMVGQVTSGGQPIGVDMTVVKGKGSTGSLTINGEKVDLRIVGSYSYMKAGSGFWKRVGGKAGGAAAQLFAGKWIKFKSTDPQFGPLAGIASESVFDKLPSEGYGDAGTTTYKGRSVKDLEASNGHVYVAATGTPYPVALVETQSDSKGTITFDRWNKPVVLTAPPGAIDVSKLGG